MGMRVLGAIPALRLVAVVAVALVLLTSAFTPFSFVRAQDDDALVGDYTVALNSEEIPQDVANAEMVVGRWRVSFLEGGAYEAERLDLGVLIEGSYEVDGETVTITDESGLVSCANAAAATGGEADVSVATYTFDRGSNSLSLTPDQEDCALRRVLLATKEFQFFVACNTSAETEATVSEEIEASPVPEDDEETDEGPAGRGTSPLDIIAIDATPGAGEEDDESADDASVEDQIDGLLSQMTACWATGDPARFLPLWSEDFRDSFLSGTEDENQAALGSLQAAMQVPITWERAGDVDLIDDETAEAVVRTTTLDEEEFVRYVFVFEDGAWRWDGSAA